MLRPFVSKEASVFFFHRLATIAKARTPLLLGQSTCVSFFLPVPSFTIQLLLRRGQNENYLNGGEFVLLFGVMEFFFSFLSSAHLHQLFFSWFTVAGCYFDRDYVSSGIE